MAGQFILGRHAWTLENKYLTDKLTVEQKEELTDKLQGVKAKVPVVVNGILQGEIGLYTTENKDLTSFGTGLSINELESLAGVINIQFNRFYFDQ